MATAEDDDGEGATPPPSHIASPPPGRASRAVSQAELDHRRRERDQAAYEMRLVGTANDAGGLFEPAELAFDADHGMVLILGIDDTPVEVHLTATDTIELFDYRSLSRFVPMAGVSATASAAKGRWLLRRAGDGLAFRPDDIEDAQRVLAEAGISTPSSVRSSWPGVASDDAVAAGCLGGAAVFGVIGLGGWLVSLAGFDLSGPGGRIVGVVLYVLVLSGFSLMFGRPLQRWLRRSAAHRVVDDD